MTESADNGKQFLVYANGFSENGDTLREEDVLAGLANGQLRPCDLVWYDGVWRQFSDIFELAPYKLSDNTDEAENDLATEFKSLPCSSIKGIVATSLDNEKHWGKRGLGGLLKHLVQRKNGTRRPFWQILVIVLLIVGTLGAGVIFGIIPLINQLLWRPASVLVYNPYPTACTITMEGTEKSLPPNGTVTISDIFGRMPRHSTLLFKHPKEKEPKKISVPLRANETVLVNPMGMLFFGVVNTKFQSAALNMSQRDQVARETREGRPPRTALTLAEKGKEFGQKMLLAQSDRPFIYSSDSVVTEGKLSFEQLGYERSPEDLERRGPSQPVTPGLKSVNLLPGVQLRGVKVHYRKGSTDVAECSFRINFANDRRSPFVPIRRFGKNCPPEFRYVEPVWGNATCTVSYGANEAKVTIRMDRDTFKVIRFQRHILGRWTYVGTCQLKNHAWKWSWNFSGKDKIRVADLDLTVHSNGQISKSYKEKRK